jgi:hypothetical protein
MPSVFARRLIYWASQLWIGLPVAVALVLFQLALGRRLEPSVFVLGCAGGLGAVIGSFLTPWRRRGSAAGQRTGPPRDQ